VKWARACFLVLLVGTARAQVPDARAPRGVSARWAEYYAAVYQVPVELVAAIIDEESGWSSSKNGTRLSYLSALHAIVCRERRKDPDPNMVTGTGSIVFYSFPQEVVNQIAERTGGRPVTVEVPSLCDGEVEIDAEGRIFLVQPFTQATGQVVERLIFMAQVTKTGEVFTDRDEKGSPVVLERVRKFPIKAGRSEVRNGKVIFPDTQRRPQLPTRNVAPLLEPN
jgi:hypothetical protein